MQDLLIYRWWLKSKATYNKSSFDELVSRDKIITKTNKQSSRNSSFSLVSQKTKQNKKQKTNRILTTISLPPFFSFFFFLNKLFLILGFHNFLVHPNRQGFYNLWSLHSAVGLNSNSVKKSYLPATRREREREREREEVLIYCTTQVNFVLIVLIYSVVVFSVLRFIVDIFVVVGAAVNFFLLGNIIFWCCWRLHYVCRFIAKFVVFDCYGRLMMMSYFPMWFFCKATVVFYF